jgi:hypothetical protein
MKTRVTSQKTVTESLVSQCISCIKRRNCITVQDWWSVIKYNRTISCCDPGQETKWPIVASGPVTKILFHAQVSMRLYANISANLAIFVFKAQHKAVACCTPEIFIILRYETMGSYELKLLHIWPLVKHIST